MTERLPDSTNLLYSELFQQCLHSLPVDRGISYVSKRIRDRTYWYLELVVGSHKRQVSIGPDSPELRAQIDSQKALVRAAAPDQENRQRLVAMLVKGGAVAPAATEARVLEVLERAGVFLVGGTLIGSHAFAAYANALGVRWDAAAMRTQDMDLAGRHIPLAVPADARPLGEALISANMGFFEVPALDRKHPSTNYRIRGREFHVDVLTPLAGPPRALPVYLSNLKTYAHPIQFLDYLLGDIQPGVIVARHGILVNVPEPARFALHKLVVAERRGANEHLKARKDREQSIQLLNVLCDERPGDIALAADAVHTMPDRFREQLIAGIRKLPDEQRSFLRKQGL